MRAVTKRHFTEREDIKLSKLVQRIGTKDWKKISKQMKDRSARQCRDRWEKFLAPDLNRGPFNSEEDNIIIEKYNQLGPQWVKIASFLSQRSDVAVKARHKYLIRHQTENDKEKNISHSESDDFTAYVDKVADSVDFKCGPDIFEDINTFYSYFEQL